MTAVLIALVFALALAGILGARRRAAESAEEAARIANNKRFYEFDLAAARHNGTLSDRRRASLFRSMLQPNPALQAFELRPGVVYAAETAEEAVRIANDELFDEVDLADARQLADHELDARVFLRDCPDDDDPYTTLRHELDYRRRIGRAGALCGNDPD